MDTQQIVAYEKTNAGKARIRLEAGKQSPWMVAFASFALLSLTASAATTVNEWTGPSGGSWGTDSNWSLGHKPTETETFDYTGTSPVEIVVDNVYTCACWLVNTYNASAQITLKGTGSVTALGTGGILTRSHWFSTVLRLNGTARKRCFMPT